MLRRERATKTEFPVSPIFGMLLKDHPAAKAFESVPTPPALDLYAGGPLLAACTLTFGILVYLIGNQAAVSALGFPLFFVGFAAWVGLIAGSAGLGSMLARRRVRKFDRLKLGSQAEDEILVGIAYADGFWTTAKRDVAWDRGFLSVSPDGLRFRGYQSEFELPAHAIQGVRLERARTSPHDKVPRLFIDWTSPNGDRNTLSLDTRSIRYDKTATRDIVGLRDRISHALQSRAENPVLAKWPPAVNLQRLDLRGAMLTFGMRDLAAFALGVVPGAILGTIIRLTIQSLPIDAGIRKILDSGFGYIQPTVPLVTGIAFVVWRFVRRYRSLPDPNQPVIDPTPLKANELPETINLQR